MINEQNKNAKNLQAMALVSCPDAPHIQHIKSGAKTKDKIG